MLRAFSISFCICLTNSSVFQIFAHPSAFPQKSIQAQRHRCPEYQMRICTLQGKTLLREGGINAYIEHPLEIIILHKNPHGKNTASGIQVFLGFQIRGRNAHFFPESVSSHYSSPQGVSPPQKPCSLPYLPFQNKSANHRTAYFNPINFHIF